MVPWWVVRGEMRCSGTGCVERGVGVGGTWVSGERIPMLTQGGGEGGITVLVVMWVVPCCRLALSSDVVLFCDHSGGHSCPRVTVCSMRTKHVPLFVNVPTQFGCKPRGGRAAL